MKEVVLFLVLLPVICSTLEKTSKVDKWTTLSFHEKLSLPHLEPFIELLESLTKDMTYGMGTKCITSLKTFSERLQKRKADAMKMFDSFSKFLPGFIDGRIVDFGHYHQCLQSSLNNTSDARYVLLQINYNLQSNWTTNQETDDWISDIQARVETDMFPVLIAVCVPKECGRQDIESALNSRQIQSFLWPNNITFFTSEAKGEDYFWDVKFHQYLSRSIILIWLLLILIGTLSCRTGHVLNSLSLVKSCQEIFAMSPVSPTDERLNAFNFYKLTYLFIPMIHHQFVSRSIAAVPFYLPGNVWLLKNGLLQFNNNSYLTVTTNSLVSGLLNTYSILPILTSFRKIPKMIVMRGLRILPLLFGLMVFSIATPFSSEPGPGPLFNYIQKNITVNCIKYGWLDMIFMQDIIPMGLMCNTFTWFMAIDMKMLIISLFILSLFRKSAALGLLALIVEFVVGVLLHIRQLANSNVSPVVLMLSPVGKIPFSMTSAETYSAPVGYLALSAVSTFFGYAFHRSRCHPIPPVNIFGTIISMIGCHLTLKLYMNIYDEFGQSSFSRWSQILIVSLARPILSSFIFGSAWFFLFRCRALLRILKWRWFVVISRLHYSIFMSHSMVISYLQQTQVQMNDYTLISGFMLLMTIIVLSFPVGFIAAVLIEFPVKNLIAHYTRPTRPIKDRIEHRQLNPIKVLNNKVD